MFLARKGNLSETLSLTGTLIATQEVKITSKIPGRVEKVPVEEGTPVKTGDVLIELERKELALSVAQAEETVAAAQAGLAKVLVPGRGRKRSINPGQPWPRQRLRLTSARSPLNV